MTLRHRLLLVYLIVVVLSVATVGVAIYELNRTQNIYGPLQIWQDIVNVAYRLKTAFPPVESPNPEQMRFSELMAREYLNLSRAEDYMDVDPIRDHYLDRVRRAYRQWQDATPETHGELSQRVYDAIDVFIGAAEREQEQLKEEARTQRTRKWALLGLVFSLTVLQGIVMHWLLRRWLLWPMERLNRQVEALAKDQPPPEPLLEAPLEMARLAAALDRARESLQVYRCQLLDNERLTTIGQFAAQLAHNLRNPLASIRAAAQVTARHERGSEYVCERMEEVVACVDRLNRWVGGLMEIARREATPTRSEDVLPLLHRVYEAARPDLAVKEMTLAVEAPAGGLTCAHDPATLEQALIAMVVNAIEASPLGGRVVLRAELVAGGRRDGGTEGQRDGGTEGWERWRDGGWVCRISVEDQGTGLPAEDPERIFEFSYSTKQKGMGLGLALARLALERQGGEVHARNRAEGGARVWVDMPFGGSQK